MLGSRLALLNSVMSAVRVSRSPFTVRQERISGVGGGFEKEALYS